MSSPSSYRYQPGDGKSVAPRYVFRQGHGPGNWVIHDRLIVADEFFHGRADHVVDWVLRRAYELGTTIIEIDDVGLMAPVAETVRRRAPAELQIIFRKRSDLLTAHNLCEEDLPQPGAVCSAPGARQAVRSLAAEVRPPVAERNRLR